MYQTFTVLSTIVSDNKKSITITFTHEIDSKTISGQSLYMYNKSTGDVVPLKYKTYGNTVTVEVINDFKVNTDYEIVVNKDISNIAGTFINMVYRETIHFKSSVNNKIKILSPSEHEELDDLKIVWQELNIPDAISGCNYQIQIATDSAYHNIISDSIAINKQSIKLDILDKFNQYFVRIRAVKDEEKGDWSDSITFVLSEQYFNRKNQQQNDNDEEIFERPFEILSYPDQGVTPERFIVELDDDINPDSIEDQIILIKHRI